VYPGLVIWSSLHLDRHLVEADGSDRFIWRTAVRGNPRRPLRAEGVTLADHEGGMGVYPADFIAAMKARGIRWFATATTVEEARVAERAGADVIVAQGMEVGGHRGAFEAASAEAAMVGLFALLPAIVDAVSVPVVATGGIADARGVAAALLLGASAVQIGTGFSTASSPPSRRRSIGRFSNRMLLPAGFRRSASPARFTNWRPGWAGGTECRSGTSPPATAIPSAASTWNSCRASG
jgi:hypothetical protein